MSFWTMLCPFPPLTTRKIKILEKWKTNNYDHVLHCSWDKGCIENKWANSKYLSKTVHLHCVKSGRIRSFSSPYFSALGLNTNTDAFYATFGYAMQGKNQEYWDGSFIHIFANHAKNMVIKFTNWSNLQTIIHTEIFVSTMIILQLKH